MKKFVLTGFSFLLPAIAFAQSSTQQIDSVQELIYFVIAFINNFLVPLIFAAAFLVFIVGVFRYLIQGASDPEKRKEGLNLIVYSIIGFFAMISVYGLVRILTGTVRLDNSQIRTGNDLPQVAPPPGAQPVPQN